MRKEDKSMNLTEAAVAFLGMFATSYVAVSGIVELVAAILKK